MEWRTLKSTPYDRLRTLLPQICMDLGEPDPGTEAGVRELYRREILEDDSFKKQGRMCKLGAWFDFIRACNEWTKRITARRYRMVEISENFMGAGQAQANMKKAAKEMAKKKKHCTIRADGSRRFRGCRRTEREGRRQSSTPAADARCDETLGQNDVAVTMFAAQLQHM